jgi:hypothetical protein
MLVFQVASWKHDYAWCSLRATQKLGSHRSRGHTLGCPKARLVLEAQSVLIGTLRKIVDTIAEGLDQETVSDSSKWNKLVHSEFQQPRNVGNWSAITLQAYIAPSTFNPNSLAEISRTRLEHAQDELWLLQAEFVDDGEELCILSPAQYV